MCETCNSRTVGHSLFQTKFHTLFSLFFNIDNTVNAACSRNFKTYCRLTSIELNIRQPEHPVVMSCANCMPNATGLLHKWSQALLFSQ